MTRAALCERLILELLGEYVEGALAPDVAAGLERHLAGCPPCQAYLETYRVTIGLTRSAPRGEVPLQVVARLQSFLRERSAGPPS